MIEMSILRREEWVLLRTKYLPAVYRPYARMVERLNRITEKIDDAEGELWLNEQQQRRVIREMFRDWKRMRDANIALRDYFRDVILTRLEEPEPS